MAQNINKKLEKMNWKNIDLTDNTERDLNILDPYSFNILLLEIDCNVKLINKETVRNQFKTELKRKTVEAIEIFNNNLDNIVKQAKIERQRK